MVLKLTLAIETICPQSLNYLLFSLLQKKFANPGLVSQFIINRCFGCFPFTTILNNASKDSLGHKSVFLPVYLQNRWLKLELLCERVNAYVIALGFVKFFSLGIVQFLLSCQQYMRGPVQLYPHQQSILPNANISNFYTMEDYNKICPVINDWGSTHFSSAMYCWSGCLYMSVSGPEGANGD